MTKIEREILSKKISAIIKSHKYSWQDLKEQIADYGYQYQYDTQEAFIDPIRLMIKTLKDNDKKILIDEWKRYKERIQFDTDKEYLKQYELFVMEELVQRARKASYYI